MESVLHREEAELLMTTPSCPANSATNHAQCSSRNSQATIRRCRNDFFAALLKAAFLSAGSGQCRKAIQLRVPWWRRCGRRAVQGKGRLAVRLRPRSAEVAARRGFAQSRQKEARHSYRTRLAPASCAIYCFVVATCRLYEGHLNWVSHEDQPHSNSSIDTCICICWRRLHAEAPRGSGNRRRQQAGASHEPAQRVQDPRRPRDAGPAAPVDGAHRAG